MLAVDHAELTSESTEVDEEVEVVVDTGSGGRRVDDDALTSRQGANHHSLEIKLLNNQGVDVGLETTSTDTHSDDAESEGSERTIGVLDDRGKTGDDEKDVTDDIDTEGGTDGSVTTEPAVGNVGTEQRHGVLPESIEGRQRERGSLTQAEGTGLAILDVVASTCGGVVWQLLLNEVGEDGSGTVVGETLAQLDEGDGVDAPGNLVGDAAEGVKLLVGGRSAIGADTEVVVLDCAAEDGGQAGCLLVLHNGLDIVAHGDARGVGRHGGLCGKLSLNGTLRCCLVSSSESGRKVAGCQVDGERET